MLGRAAPGVTQKKRPRELGRDGCPDLENPAKHRLFSLVIRTEPQWPIYVECLPCVTKDQVPHWHAFLAPPDNLGNRQRVSPFYRQGNGASERFVPGPTHTAREGWKWGLELNPCPSDFRACSPNHCAMGSGGVLDVITGRALPSEIYNGVRV